MCARLIELAVALVAVERPDGLLIERLLDVGLSVIAIHPNQVAAMRPRFRSAVVTVRDPISGENRINA